MNTLVKYITLFFLLFFPSLVISQAVDSKFLVKFKDEVTPYRLTGVFVLPNEEINIETLFEEQGKKYTLLSRSGEIVKSQQNKWTWKAPAKKGIYPIVIKESGEPDSVTLQCIVMIPYNQLSNGKINGYRIGNYPASSNKLYKLPKGFIEVTEENQHTFISPHYQLKDFLCKQAGGYPKYVVLKERGIIKLETIQAQLNLSGISFDKFSFISGYRTPFYNKAIGNVKNSRHVFGDAYDVYVDQNKDGQMDDVNGDGILNKKDARFLINKINEFAKQPWYKPFIGGLGLYGPNSRHTSFIHIDSRGYRARWGQ